MPLLIDTTTPNGGRMGVWHITENSGELAAMVSLNDNDAQKLNSFVREGRRCEWLSTRVLLKHLTGDEPQISYRPNGAPFCENLDAHISLSHTSGYAAVVVNPLQPVGIDIEIPSERVLKVSDRFLNEHEKNFIPHEHEMLYKTLCWSAKEALFKWWDKNDVLFKEELLLNAFTVTQGNFEINASVARENIQQNVCLQGIVSNGFSLVYIG